MLDDYEQLWPEQKILTLDGYQLQISKQPLDHKYNSRKMEVSGIKEIYT